MNRSSADLLINLNDFLTPASFSTIVVQLLKYIAYNSKSIPYPYEGFSHFVNRRRHLLSIRDAVDERRCYKDILAENYFIKVSEAYDNYEATFNSLWEEFKNPSRVKQVIFLHGTTLVCPRFSYRIRKPYISVEEAENAAPLCKTSQTLIRALLGSSHMSSIFDSVREPLNLFVLIELAEGQVPMTEWFIPFDSFAPLSTRKEIKIVINSPSPTKSSFEQTSDEGSDNQTLDSSSNWFRSKETLKGFKDMKIAGKSVANLLLRS